MRMSHLEGKLTLERPIVFIDETTTDETCNGIADLEPFLLSCFTNLHNITGEVTANRIAWLEQKIDVLHARATHQSRSIEMRKDAQTFQSVGLRVIALTLTRIPSSATSGIGLLSVTAVFPFSETMTARWVLVLLMVYCLLV